jgi:hypothetical protein
MVNHEETQENAQNDTFYTEDAQDEKEIGQEKTQENYAANEEQRRQENYITESHSGGESNFVHGLAVGLGIGCIATFVIVWISLFFTPKLPTGVTYENLLSIFVYPLIYLLAVGLVALTAGVVREYYSRKNKF